MAKKRVEYIPRVVYGFREKLEIVLLGELKSGKVKNGMHIQVTLKNGFVVGDWVISEVLHADFINQRESPNFLGFIIQCKNYADFDLLKALRVYDEVMTIVDNKPKKGTK